MDYFLGTYGPDTWIDPTQIYKNGKELANYFKKNPADAEDARINIILQDPSVLEGLRGYEKSVSVNYNFSASLFDDKEPIEELDFTKFNEFRYEQIELLCDDKMVVKLPLNLRDSVIRGPWVVDFSKCKAIELLQVSDVNINTKAIDDLLVVEVASLACDQKFWDLIAASTIKESALFKNISKVSLVLDAEIDASTFTKFGNVTTIVLNISEDAKSFGINLGDLSCVKTLTVLAICDDATNGRLSVSGKLPNLEVLELDSLADLSGLEFPEKVYECKIVHPTKLPKWTSSNSIEVLDLYVEKTIEIPQNSVAISNLIYSGFFGESFALDIPELKAVTLTGTKPDSKVGEVKLPSTCVSIAFLYLDVGTLILHDEVEAISIKKADKIKNAKKLHSLAITTDDVSWLPEILDDIKSVKAMEFKSYGYEPSTFPILDVKIDRVESLEVLVMYNFFITSDFFNSLPKSLLSLAVMDLVIVSSKDQVENFIQSKTFDNKEDVLIDLLTTSLTSFTTQEVQASPSTIKLPATIDTFSSSDLYRIVKENGYDPVNYKVWFDFSLIKKAIVTGPWTTDTAQAKDFELSVGKEFTNISDPYEFTISKS